MIHRTALLLPLLSALLATVNAQAQFTSDPSTPDILANGANDQVQSKVVPIAGGGFYMSWYDNSAGGYDPWVQRFTASGVGVWPGNGIRVLDTNFSSTEDYGLTTDAAGNAVIVTRSDAGGNLRIVAQAISPAGALLWTPGGVVLSTSSNVNSPKAGRAGDGAAVAGWTEASRAKILRLNANGTPAWATPATMTDGTATTILSDLQPGENGTVISSAVRYTTFSGAKTLQAQKYSSTGAALWVTTNVRIFSTGSLQFGNFPPFVADGEGGAVFSWYSTATGLQSYAQWVTPTGDLRFGVNGVSVTPTADLERTGPTATYDPAQRRVYVAYTEHVANSSLYTSAAQSFSETGERMWGASGTQFVPMSTTYQHTQPRIAMLGGFPTGAWVNSTSYGFDTAYARSYTTDGVERWMDPIRLSPVTLVGRLLFTPSGATPASLLAIWEGGAIGTVDIFGALLNSDGSLGVAGVCGDLNADGRVNGADLGLLLGAWGPADGSPYDLNHDGVVNGADLGLLLGCWTTG